MFRAFLVVVTGAVALLLLGGPSHLFDPAGRDNQLAGGTKQTTSTSFVDAPAIRVLSAPSVLMRNETGVVEVQAESPAVPGATVILDTAGTYGMGYYKVSQAVLDNDLRATLPVLGRDYVGTFKYWATIPASGTYQAGTSATFTIQFATPSVPAPREDMACEGETPLKANGTPWQCTYDDEFTGDTLDRRFWVPQTGGSTTGSGSMTACAADLPETIAVRNGMLELSVVELPQVRSCTRRKTSKYAFGQVMHYGTFSQTYGKYEIRAKLPDLREPGVQESFWLWPKKNTYGAWPASGEIDFAEHYSSRPDLDRPYLHYLPGATTAGTNDNVTNANCPIRSGEFNTYGVEWEPGRITVLLNGEVCFIDDYSSATAAVHGQNSPFDKPFYLSLNQAMGASGNVYDPAVVPDKVTTQVDYVRIWK
jgi:beta-glucanase (GH16 family)